LGLDPPRDLVRKPRPTIRATLILVAALAADFALFRNAKTRVNSQSAAVWLYVILIVFIWRYVPAPWDRRAIVLIFLIPLAVLLILYALFDGEA
jgi:cell division protein FtsW (lipid II flippase)